MISQRTARDAAPSHVRVSRRLVAVFTLGIALLVGVGGVGGVGGAWADTGSASPTPGATTSASVATSAASSTNPGLRGTVSGTAAAPDLVLTNAASVPCQVAGASLGTTVFDRVTERGAAG